ncbi:peroxidasin homolog [Plutella xylostella]|uniref:peroxidasin homolog n=1 Tax=Plutella xylostella TaxID=51655 RepID=UPI002032E6A2|nr:peroxidasin homolog [Plutella xylostella]
MAKIYDILTVERDIATEAEHTLVEAHTRKTFTCRSNNYKHKIQWLDPTGQPVPRTDARVVVHHVTSRVGAAAVLVLTSAEVQDTGVWTCRARGASVDVAVCVIESTVFTSSHQELSVDEGRAATLDCGARGNPEPRLAWYKNDEQIFDEDNSTKYLVMNRYSTHGVQSSLTIKSLTWPDGGQYACRAVQDHPAMEACSVTAGLVVTLHVREKPIFDDVDSIRNAFARVDERIQLNCTANGYPPPVYSWFLEKDKDVLEDLKNTEFSDSFYNITENTLEIVTNEITFGRRYRCRAGNTYGYADKVFVVLNVEKPTVPSVIHLLNKTENELMLSLIWDKDVVFPIDEILVQYTDDEFSDISEWIHLYDIITTSNESLECQVKLKNLESDTEYRVRVRISNAAGQSEWSESYSFRTNSDDLRALTTILEEQLSVGIYSFLLLVTVAVFAWISCWWCKNIRW